VTESDFEDLAVAEEARMQRKCFLKLKCMRSRNNQAPHISSLLTDSSLTTT